MKRGFLIIVLWMVLAACSTAIDESQSIEISDTISVENRVLEKEQAIIPDAYAGLANPIEASESSLSRGAETYATFCASCHGDQGLGDGPASPSLEPPPANLVEAGQTISEDYLYWRLSEGGIDEPFNSAMPPWKTSLDETARWNTINYIQSLGQEEAN